MTNRGHRVQPRRQQACGALGHSGNGGADRLPAWAWKRWSRACIAPAPRLMDTTNFYIALYDELKQGFFSAWT